MLAVKEAKEIQKQELLSEKESTGIRMQNDDEKLKRVFIEKICI